MEFIGPDVTVSYLLDEREAWLATAERSASRQILLSMAAGNHLPSTDQEKKAKECWINALEILEALRKRGVTFDEKGNLELKEPKEPKSERPKEQKSERDDQKRQKIEQKSEREEQKRQKIEQKSEREDQKRQKIEQKSEGPIERKRQKIGE